MENAKCNICGSAEIDHTAPFYKCKSCHSFARMRIVSQFIIKYILNNEYTSLNLASKIDRKHIRGIGLSDHHTYSPYLEKIFNYVNTFYHCEPRLDITNSSDIEKYTELDFIVSTDVFEHTRPPAELAFNNAASMLRKGGILIFSVPTNSDSQTVERYPSLNKYKIVNIEDKYLIINININGTVELFSDPIFHGGIGEAVEMRIFSETHVISLLTDTGFNVMNIFNIRKPILSDHQSLMKAASIRPDARCSTFFICERT